MGRRPVRRGRSEVPPPGVPRAPVRARTGRARTSRIRRRRRRTGRPYRGDTDARAPWQRLPSCREARGAVRRRVASRSPRRRHRGRPRSARRRCTRSPTRAGTSCSTRSSSRASAGRSGSTRLDGVAPPSLVALLRPSRTGAAGGRGASALRRPSSVYARSRGVGLRALGARASAPVVRAVTCGRRDTALRRLLSPSTAWAVVADGALDWYATSPYVRVLEPDDGSRALVQLPGWPREPLRVAAWDSPSAGLRSALRAPRRGRAACARDTAPRRCGCRSPRATRACVAPRALSASWSATT